MKRFKLFPGLFLSTLAILTGLVVVVHLTIYFIFQPTFLMTRKQALNQAAEGLAQSLEGLEVSAIRQSLEVYSNGNTIKAFIQTASQPDSLPVDDQVDRDLTSHHNSLIIEERSVQSKDHGPVTVQIVSTADIKKEAKDLSLAFLPYSIALSFLIALLIAYIYAKVITHHIQQVKRVTDRMMRLDPDAQLPVNSYHEIGQLKDQLNHLYRHLLAVIEQVEANSAARIELERLRFDFFTGASHDLKTPLASLQIILENMKYRVGKFKDRDTYIDRCLELTQDLSASIRQILALSSVDQLGQDEEWVQIGPEFTRIYQDYALWAQEKSIQLVNHLEQECLYIGRSAFQIVLSNLISNAIKYSKPGETIEVGSRQGWFYMQNTSLETKQLPLEEDGSAEVKSGDIGLDSTGLGLFIIKRLLDNYHVSYRYYRRDGRWTFLIQYRTNSISEEISDPN